MVHEKAICIKRAGKQIAIIEKESNNEKKKNFRNVKIIDHIVFPFSLRYLYPRGLNKFVNRYKYSRLQIVRKIPHSVIIRMKKCWIQIYLNENWSFFLFKLRLRPCSKCYGHVDLFLWIILILLQISGPKTTKLS